MSIFNASFYNWFGSLPAFFQNLILYIQGRDNALQSFFVTDARPLSYGPVFHILLASALFFAILNWRFSSFERKAISLLTVLLLAVMSIGHTAPFLRFNFGIGLFILPAILLLIANHSPKYQKVVSIVLAGVISFSIPLNYFVASQKIKYETSIPKENNLSRFYSSKSIDFPECPKVYLLTQLPMFNAYIWGERMCGSLVPFSEANVVISTLEDEYINGVNKEKIICNGKSNEIKVSTIFSYPSRIYLPTDCRRNK
jgi:hypothetical protein